MEPSGAQWSPVELSGAKLNPVEPGGAQCPVLENVFVPPPTKFWPKVPPQKARNSDKAEFATKVRRSNINCVLHNCVNMSIKNLKYFPCKFFTYLLHISRICGGGIFE